MKKIFSIFIFLLALIMGISLVGCDSENVNGGVGDLDGGYTSYIGYRKIAYSVDLGVSTSDIYEARKLLDESAGNIGGYLEDGYDRYDKSQMYSSYATYRIPTEKVFEFIAEIEALGLMNNKSVSTVDFTQNYISVQAEKTALTNKRELLVETLSDAGISSSDKIILINEISSIDVQLASIELRISGYDSMADMSTVSVIFTLPPTFIDVFMPFLILIIIPAIVLGIIFIPKAIKRRKQKKVTE